MKKYELIVLTMYKLQGNEIALDIEDIAMKSEEISPGAFAWRKYKNQINLELVGFAMRDAKKEKYGAYVYGNHARGWRLTPSGTILGKELSIMTKSKVNIKASPSRANSLHSRRISQNIKRVLDSEAFLNWSEGGKADINDLKRLLKINTYTSNDLVLIKISRLEKVRGVESSLDDFLDYLNSIKGELI